MGTTVQIGHNGQRSGISCTAARFEGLFGETNVDNQSNALVLNAVNMDNTGSNFEMSTETVTKTGAEIYVQLFDFSVMLVGGGGGCGIGGSGRGKGAGGAGEVLHGTLSLAPGTYTITIGSGGTTTSSSSVRSNNGGDTTISGGGITYTAKGGGGGACAQDGNLNNAGGVGGSGGGSVGSASGGGTSGGTNTGTAGTLTSYKNAGGNGVGSASSADSHVGGGGAGSTAWPASGANRCCYPVQYGLGGDPITLGVNGTNYNVASGGNPILGNWANYAQNGLSSSKTYSNGSSSTQYGDGGSNSGNGKAGAFIIGRSGISNVVKTSSTTITVSSTGTIS